MDIRKRFLLQRVLGTDQAPRGMSTALRLVEPQEHLVILSDTGGIVGVSVHELDQ